MKIKILFFLLISVIGFSQKKKINEEYDYINNYKDIQNTRYWRKLEQKAKKYHDAYLKKVDFNLRKELNLMAKEDQRVRTNGFDAEGTKIVDSINNEKPKKIVADCDCYPNYSLNLIDSNSRSNGVYRYGIYNNVKKERIEEFENLDKRRIAVGLAPWQLDKDILKLIRKKYGF